MSTLSPAMTVEPKVIRRVGKDCRVREYIFTKRVRVLSYGAGVDSTAMLIKMYEEGHPFIVLHADVGAETKATLPIVQFYKRWCEDRGIEFVIVKRGDFCDDKRNIDEYHHDKHIIPSKMRRDCTSKYKINPKRKYLRQRFGKDAIFENYIGYNADEKKRADKAKSKPQDVMYEECVYPMVDWFGMGRQAEKDFIASKGLPVPEKSGCYFCPYISRNGWKIVYFTNKDEFDKSRFYIEENSREYAKAMLPETKKKDKILLAGNVPLSEIQAECEKMTPEEIKKLLESGIERCLATGF